MKIKKLLSLFLCFIFMLSIALHSLCSFNAMAFENQPQPENTQTQETGTQTEFKLYSQSEFLDYILHYTRNIFNKFGIEIDLKIEEPKITTSYNLEHDSSDSESPFQYYEPICSNSSLNNSYNLLENENFDNIALQTETSLYTEFDLKQGAFQTTLEILRSLGIPVDLIINENL